MTSLINKSSKSVSGISAAALKSFYRPSMKGSATSEDKGAPPDIKNLILPPSLAFILL